MIYKWQIGKWRFTFTVAPTTEVTGVNSTLKDGNHILMWDFDDKTLDQVRYSLKIVQDQYKLPNIYICNTGKENHYNAYCFFRVPWQLAMEIVVSTPNVDLQFFKYSVYREHFTLRISEKEGRDWRLVDVLKGRGTGNVALSELESFTKYQTILDEHQSKVKWLWGKEK
ncbi:MAG: hypothetical protein JRE40_03360 [Deltaproteobacteria bacterium]|nr:hypothetical protein [Deltaproteobacteria bacterium]MBW2672982.1 hypothetical protein [Deltaproteobacteria bacterium]